jgi:hypothetical protein
MTKDDILRMAREAGGSFEELPLCDAWLFYEEEYLERFAALVAAQEREACAKVCENISDYDENVDEYYSDIYVAAIRERNNT